MEYAPASVEKQSMLFIFGSRGIGIRIVTTLFADESDADNDGRDDQAGAIMQRKNDRVRVHSSAAGNDPGSTEPIQQERADQPKHLRMPIKQQNFGTPQI